MQGRLTLLLGPPSCGKTTFLKALAGRLREDQFTGSIQYNGHNLSDFVAARTVAFVAQDDNHIPNLTARETVKFAFDIQRSPNSAPLP
jgi:ABC-type multidrug transport system ATPase subunit